MQYRTYPPNTDAIDKARLLERLIAREYRIECMIQRQVQEAAEQTRIMHHQAVAISDIADVILAMAQLMLSREKRERDA